MSPGQSSGATVVFVIALAVVVATLPPPANANRWAAFCPPRCLCNDNEFTVSCADAALDVVPLTLNPAVKQVFLPRNQIINIEPAFGVYSHVEVLDVSSNKVTRLGARGSEVTALRRLDLSHNFVTTIERDAFKGLQKLTHLILRRNSLSELPSSVFTPLRDLQVLDLSYNKLSSISSGAFHGLTSLERLNLRSNTLGHVPSDSFIYLSTVRALDLGLNPFTVLDESAFYSLKHLEELQLDECSLAEIHPDAFLGAAPTMRKLNLQNNKLPAFPVAISRLTALEELHIGGNRFVKIFANDLKHLRKLKRLHLTRSERLERIEDGAFKHTPELEELWMEFNMQLEHLPATLLSHLRQLRKVGLRGNGMRYIHPELLPLDRLESFDVSHNPLVCNCSLSWLWRHMAERPHQHHNSSALRCGGPANLERNFLASLNNAQLECEESSSALGLIAVAATSLAVFCIVAGVLVVTWRRRIILNSDGRTGTIIKDLDFSSASTETRSFASYDNHKYPYVIQSLPPYATLVPSRQSPPAVISDTKAASMFQAVSASFNSGAKAAANGASANGLRLDPGYTTLSPTALQSYFMNLSRHSMIASSMVNDPASATINNHAYQTLPNASYHTDSSAASSSLATAVSTSSTSSRTPSDTGYETIPHQAAPCAEDPPPPPPSHTPPASPPASPARSQSASARRLADSHGNNTPVAGRQERPPARPYRLRSQPPPQPVDHQPPLQELTTDELLRQQHQRHLQELARCYSQQLFQQSLHQPGVHGHFVGYEQHPDIQPQQLQEKEDCDDESQHCSEASTCQRNHFEMQPQRLRHQQYHQLQHQRHQVDQQQQQQHSQHPLQNATPNCHSLIYV